MIEQYFLRGTVWHWAPPAPIVNQLRDGKIVESGNAHPPALTYAGLNAEITHLAQERALIAAIFPHFNVPYHWLDYIHARTAFVRPGGADVLTGFMSGCWICSWGNRKVGHVGTIESAAKFQPPNSTVKHVFSNDMSVLGNGNLTGYNPAAALDPDAIANVMRQVADGRSIRPKIMSSCDCEQSILVRAHDQQER